MKNYKKLLLLLIALAIFVMLAGYIMWRSVDVGICPPPVIIFDGPNEKPCAWRWEERGGVFMITPFVFLPFIIIMFFLPKRFFDAWKWFAFIFGVISILLITWAPMQGGGLMPIDKGRIILSMSIIFAIISFIIIIFQTYYYFRDKKKNTVK